MFVVIYDNFTGRNPFFLVFVLKKNHTFKFDVMVKVQVLFIRRTISIVKIYWLK